jgi:hypothetical protein
MTKKLNFDAIHGHVEHEPAHCSWERAAELVATKKPDADASPTKKRLDFSAIYGHIQHSPAPTPEETKPTIEE